MVMSCIQYFIFIDFVSSNVFVLLANFSKAFDLIKFQNRHHKDEKIMPLDIILLH